ncbi:MAG: hypothetical protein ABJC36_06095 [Gemmatimonadales bacterium]
MLEDRIPTYLSVVAAIVLAATVLILQPYTAEWPGHGFARPAERYVHAALAQDSVTLARLSVADSPVAWALAMARQHPEALAAWAHQSQAWTGQRHGDTTQVFVYSRAAVCGDAPIEFRFVDGRGQARVLAAGLACRDSTPASRGPYR